MAYRKHYFITLFRIVLKPNLSTSPALDYFFGRGLFAEDSECLYRKNNCLPQERRAFERRMFGGAVDVLIFRLVEPLAGSTHVVDKLSVPVLGSVTCSMDTCKKARRENLRKISKIPAKWSLMHGSTHFECLQHKRKQELDMGNFRMEASKERC